MLKIRVRQSATYDVAMKRRAVLRIGVFVLLGAIVNIATAWILAAWPESVHLRSGDRNGYGAFARSCLDGDARYTTNVFRDHGDLDIFQFPERWGIDIEWWSVNPSTRAKLIPSWSVVRGIEPLASYMKRHPGPGLKYHERATGWPMLSLRYWWLMPAGWEPHWSNSAVDPTIESGGLVRVPRRFLPRGNRNDLPYLPIWPGFIFNAAFYAIILWMVFQSPFVLRRMVRRRRNLCPACAYPIGISNVCTECGGEVHQQKTNYEQPTAVSAMTDMIETGWS